MSSSGNITQNVDLKSGQILLPNSQPVPRVEPAPHPPAKKRYRPCLSKAGHDPAQSLLDFGQKSLGTKHCPTCGFVFSGSSAADEELHQRYHRSTLAPNVKYTPTTADEVLAYHGDGGCVLLVPEQGVGTASRLAPAAARLRDLVDCELAFVGGQEDTTTRQMVNTAYFRFKVLFPLDPVLVYFHVFLKVFCIEHAIAML